jgi:CHAD domain-containing protein/CYTH domain-containing protein
MPASGQGLPFPSLPLLEHPAPEAARLLALRQLDEWYRARLRLDLPADPEALHDFRVALRRLRSLLRALRSPSHRVVPRRLSRRLRRLARASGESRDLEVRTAWLLAQLPALTSRQRAGARWLISDLENRQRAANERLRRTVVKRFGPLLERLRSALADGGPVEVAGEPGQPVSVGAVVGQTLLRGTASLEHQLGLVHAITDDAAAHAARITVKRLRYLLEPFQADLSGAAAAVNRLKQLQDLLGDLHDCHRIAAELAQVFRSAALAHAQRTFEEILPWEGSDGEPRSAKETDQRAGLLALARRLGSRGGALFTHLKSDWLEGDAAARLCAELRTIGDLAATPRRAGIEIERKYLLSRLPSHVLDFPSEEIEQGWLPGRELVERLRQVRSNGTTSWYRTVKTGQGLQRIEIEEATTPELFEALWPLTSGCRVRKRRYVVPEGALTWEIDQFLDRNLILAEIELPTADTQFEIPVWLAEYLVREVTGEPEFVNRTLAR